MQNGIIVDRVGDSIVIGVTDSDALYYEDGARIRMTLEEARELFSKLEDVEIDMLKADIDVRDAANAKRHAEFAEKEAQRVARINEALANPPAPPDTAL